MVVLLIEKHILELSRNEGCAKVASELLERTAHITKVRSVASGAAFCIFSARLVEAFGARTSLQSIVPGKGNVVHQLIALAFPRAVTENVSGIQEGKSFLLSPYLDDAERTLQAEGAIFDTSRDTIPLARLEAEKMMYRAAQSLPEISNRIGLRLDHARVYTEFQLMSYRLHMWGVLDALIEDAEARKAVVIDWKTAKLPIEAALQVYDTDFAQVAAYALLEADRLGYPDPRLPVSEGAILPIIVRSGGRIPVISDNPIYLTVGRKKSTADFLDNIILAAEHLSILVSNVEKLLGPSVSGQCRLRQAPKQLPRADPKRGRYPCKACTLQEECNFYIASLGQPGDFERLAWRSRHATYSIRENALRPYKELERLVGFLGYGEEVDWSSESLRLDSGNVVDFFSEVVSTGNSIVLRRDITDKEIEQERLISLRQGKPAAMFFSEANVANPLLALGCTGRVDEIALDGQKKVEVTIGPPSIPLRLNPILFSFYLEKWPDLARRVIAVETNVDLTYVELRAIDAFERGTKTKLALRLAKARDLTSEISQIRDEELDVLFGAVPDILRRRSP